MLHLMNRSCGSSSYSDLTKYLHHNTPKIYKSYCPIQGVGDGPGLNSESEEGFE